MSGAQFILGVALLALGGAFVLGRERIVVRARRRSGGRYVQPPVTFVVLGAMLAVNGAVQILLAVR